MNLRYRPDGSFDIPMKGMPPDTVPGYKQDEQDPWHWIPIQPDCDFRIQIRIPLPCCPSGKVLTVCESQNNMPVNPGICSTCTRDKIK